jgi:hypothetical protein
MAAGVARADEYAIPAAEDPAWSMCADTAAQVEAEYGIPAYLLKAVSLTETGRSGPNRRVSSWPWTVHDGSVGHYFATKEAAVAFVREIRTDGKRSIDVGCMQVNLRHHPRAFTSVAAGFDPLVNIRYAAQFLTQLKDGAANWQEAIARYHSFSPDLEDYAYKVLTYWARERQQAALTPAKAQAPKLVAASGPGVLLASAELGFAANSPTVISPAGSAQLHDPAKRLLAWPK